MGRVLHDADGALHQREHGEAPGGDPELPGIAHQQHDRRRDQDEDLEVAHEARQGRVRVPGGRGRDGQADGGHPEHGRGEPAEPAYPAAQRLHRAHQHQHQRGGVGRADLAGGAGVARRDGEQQHQDRRGERQQGPVSRGQRRRSSSGTSGRAAPTPGVTARLMVSCLPAGSGRRRPRCGRGSTGPATATRCRCSGCRSGPGPRWRCPRAGR